MTTRDFAVDLEPDASPERLHEIERILHKVVAEYLVRAAIEIDDRERNGRIRFPTEAAAVCRGLAAEHLNQT